MPSRHHRRAGLVVLGAALTLAGGDAQARRANATAAIDAAAAARITSLVAGAHEIFALRGNAVVSFDADGREVARCARFEAPPPERPAPPRAGAVDAEEALRLAGLPDDDLETAEAEDVLDDEGFRPRRRPRAADEPGIVARAIASSPAIGDVWIATSAGLYRGRGRSCTRVALPGRNVVAVAAAGGGVAVASEELLWRSDGAGAFRIAAGLTARPRAIAVAGGGRTLIANDDGVLEIEPFGAVRPVLDRGSDALAVCDGIAMAFAGDGVFTWTGDESPRRAGDRPPARTLACGGARGERFIASGGGLFVSPDGVAWHDRTPQVGQAIDAAAAIDGRIWIAVAGDLVALDGPVPPAFDRGARRASSLPVLPPPATRTLLAPTFPWPQLTVVFAGQRTPLRSGWSLVLLLGFRFGRGGGPGTDRRHLAAELVRRDAALAGQELELSASDSDDPSRGARLRAVRQEREALR